MQLSRDKGYDIRTYDEYGRERYRETRELVMQEQHPTGQMAIFQNLRGYAWNFVFYQSKIDLPMKVAKVGLDLDLKFEDPNCLIYYRFDKNLVNDQTQIINLVKDKEINYEWATYAPGTKKVQYKERDYSERSLQIDRNTKISEIKFDGITCEDDRKVMKSVNGDAYIEVMTDYGLFRNGIPGIPYDQGVRGFSAVTVEFWIRIPFESW